MGNGVGIKCCEETCSASFHISCALRAGFSMNIESDSEEVGGYKMISLCYEHSVNASPTRHALSPTKQGLNKAHSPNVGEIGYVIFPPSTHPCPMQRIDNASSMRRMMREFWKYVDCSVIALRLKVSQPHVNAVCKYWRWKRALLGYQPLIREPVDMPKIGLPVDVVRPILQARQSLSPRRAFSPISTKQMQEYEKLLQLRQNLEKARNLCWYAVRREKGKKAVAGVLEEVVELVEKAYKSNHRQNAPVNGKKGKSGDVWSDELRQLLGRVEEEQENEETLENSTTVAAPVVPSAKKSIRLSTVTAPLIPLAMNKKRSKVDHHSKMPILRPVTKYAPSQHPAPAKLKRLAYESLHNGFARSDRMRRGGSSASATSLTSNSSTSSNSLYSLAQSSTLYNFDGGDISDDIGVPLVLKPLNGGRVMALTLRSHNRPNGLKGMVRKKQVSSKWGLQPSQHHHPLYPSKPKPFMNGRLR